MAGKACSWDRWSHEGATEGVIPTNGVANGDPPGTMETSCCSNSAGIDGTGGKCGRSHLQFQGQHATVEIRNRTNWICGWEWLKDLVGGVPNLAWCNEVSLNFLDGFFLSTKPHLTYNQQGETRHPQHKPAKVYRSDSPLRHAERLVRSKGATVLAKRVSSPNEVPSPAAKSWVSDTVGILNPHAVNRINNMATELRRDTGAELV